MKLARFVSAVGNDHGAVIRGGRVELHAAELNQLGHFATRALEFRIGLLEIDLTVVGAAVVGGYHPCESVLTRLQRVRGDGVYGVAADDGLRRTCCAIPPDAVATVNVMIAGEPMALGGTRAAAIQRQGSQSPQDNGAPERARCIRPVRYRPVHASCPDELVN